jgi:uncharacterized protein YdeI (YjbR/CyaY-like superfamily)
MNDWVTFEGAVETLEMGRSTYTIIRVPPAAAAVLEAAGARRVEGEIDDVALALSRADRMQAWDALTPGKRRGLLYRIDTAKTQATRAKRIDALVAGLDS